MILDASPLVSTDWLAEHLDELSLRVVDVRWGVRYENGRGVSFDDRDGYLAGHIPGAVFAGMVTELWDPSNAIPDMLAPPEQFAAAMGRLGIDRRGTTPVRSSAADRLVSSVGFEGKEHEQDLDRARCHTDVIHRSFRRWRRR